jgi:hypothetical protein
MDSSVLALIAGAAAGVTNALVSAVTMAWPTRPSYVALVCALVFGIVVTFLAAFAYLPATVVFDRQAYAQIVLAGLGSGLAAAGIGASAQSANDKRDVATNAPEPVSPQGKL